MSYLEPLTRTQRAHLVGQYHTRKAFDDLRIWASWYNSLSSTERSFVRFYQQLNRPGALERADVDGLPWRVGKSFTVTINVDTTEFRRSVEMMRAALEIAHSVKAPEDFSALDKAPYNTAERFARLRLGATLLALEFHGHGLPVWFCDMLERHTPALLLPDLWWMNQRIWRARMRRGISRILRQKASS